MTVRSMAINEMNLFRFGSGHVQELPGAPGNSSNNASSSAGNPPRTSDAIRDTGSSLLDAINTLTGQGRGALQGTSSETDVATVSINTSRLIASMPPQDTTINVRQLAQAQRNEGASLAANGSAVESGVHRFSIESNGRTYSFQINVQDGDNNERVQRLMAEAINNSNVGVTASVATNAQSGTSFLQLESSETGEGNSFTITDTNGGNLVQTMSVDVVTQEATNAIFTINGGDERTSQSNEISIAAGVTATLQGEGVTEITFGRSTNDMVQAVRDLVSAINSGLSGTNGRDGRGSERFLSDLRGLTSTFAPQLERIGISVANNGRLTIDQDRLNSAAAEGRLEDMFTGNGFGARVARIAENAANTNHYANRPAPVSFSGNGFDFGNTANTSNILNLFG